MFKREPDGEMRPACCAVCDEPIEDEYCYVLDKDFPFESSVHISCMRHELGKLKDVAFFIRDNIEVYFSDDVGLSKTPQMENVKFYWED